VLDDDDDDDEAAPLACCTALARAGALPVATPSAARRAPLLRPAPPAGPPLCTETQRKFNMHIGRAIFSVQNQQENIYL
jgi:hypothetical protein